MKLMLQAVDRLVGPGMRVLAAGCGEGQSARAAAARGATVRAVDHDPEMVARAWASGVPAELGTVEDLVGDYDVVLSSLWADDVLRLAPTLTSRVRKGGAIYVSGAPRPLRALFEQAFEPLAVTRVDDLGDLCGLELRRPA
jgi:2-polyprenyl-3-methyl-5-hydroxy-6-metoxy-1,4-benzoquinol methylase